MTKFSVCNESDTYVVNLAEKTCACRKWDLSGIPCAHAIVCIWYNGLVVENYVSSYYRKSQCLATYAHIVLPSNGPRLWPVTNTEHIHPPVMRQAPGRPKKLRNKSNDEPKNSGVLPRQLKTVKCTHYGKYGHNSRTCKGKSAADRQIPKGGNKQPNKKQKANDAEVIPQGSQAPQTQPSQQ
ncbi:uncharacterized protein LOC131661258 [Vicia villosa]|uniref:uncharacterized protein LOC131661258 n=1 Tax=Vicia villosa TaxID=3911 RepID=UPI00273AE261|nr:uncharacterized protein LOC131661258 [Vicia villosa]